MMRARTRGALAHPMEAPLNPKIQELVTRLNRDPDSKIFLQLAEEYRKAGLLEEALLVCKAGLKKHPGYHSARVALGRIYLALNRLEEARAEFEAMVRAAPDNLLANRMLGDVLALSGDAPGAIEHYRAVLAFGPADAEIRARIEALERGEDARQIGRRRNAPGAAVAAPQRAPAGPAPGPTTAPSRSGFRRYLPDDAGAPADAASAPARAAAPPPLPSRPAVAPAPEVRSSPSPGAPAAAAAGSPSSARPAEYRRRAAYVPPPEVIRPPTAAPPQPARPAAAVAEASAAPAAGSISASRDSMSTHTLAELYVRQGFIDRAIDVYRRLLHNDPTDPTANRRLAELAGRLPGGSGAPAAAADAPASAVSVQAGAGLPGAQAGAVERLERWLKSIQSGSRQG
jgi:tetratricopeptide (TPR) repeat protein